MPLPSPDELPGSPVSQTSWASDNYFWDPSAEVSSGSTFSAPTATIYEYDPAYPSDAKDVTATVCAGGAFMGSGANANQVGVTITALTAGYEYRVQLGCASSDGNQPGAYFRVRCQV